MAQKRMFSLKIIDTDLFVEMPTSTQLLYFHLSMRADDDGFISSPKKITKMVSCSDDDLKLLIAKQFIIPFESGICVIKDWKIHNYIAKDRYQKTQYIDENNQLYQLENGSYTKCIQNVDKMETQVRLDKIRLDKVRLGKNSIVSDTTKVVSSTKVQPIIEKWNSLGLQKLISIKQGTTRYKLLQARLKEYEIDKILEAIENINNSSFLKGQNGKGWTISFDWLIKPNNFIKVLEGNYKDKEGVNSGSGVNGNFGKDNETEDKYSGYDFG